MVNNYKLLNTLNNISNEEIKEHENIRILNTTTNPYSLDGYVEIKVGVAPQTIIMTYNCTTLSLPLNDMQVFLSNVSPFSGQNHTTKKKPDTNIGLRIFVEK